MDVHKDTITIVVLPQAAEGADYALHRALVEWSYACDVIAPSLIPKRVGV